jgi:hypothetical protein
MPKSIPTKSTFGTIKVNNISPALPDTVPVGMNIHISFEEALKLNLGLQQLLLKLNSYNRNTKEGKNACVNLCLFRDVHSLTINEGQLGNRKAAKPPRPIDDLDALLNEYIAAVEAANLAPTTRDTYILHASNFVRWVRGSFQPGSRKE